MPSCCPVTVFAALTGAFGLIVGVVGAAYGVKAYGDAKEDRRKLARIEDRRRAQMWASIQESDRAIGDHDLLRGFLERLGEPAADYWLSTTYQAACDLYMTLVERFLEEETFTWADLRRMSEAGGLSWRWQEEYWRTLMMRRPENSTQPVPAVSMASGHGPLARSELKRLSRTGPGDAPSETPRNAGGQ